MKQRAQRAIAECLRIGEMTEDTGRITRRFLTPPVHAVHAHLRRRMESLGMTVRVDAAGNLRGVWQPEGAPRKRLAIGSHIDTVPDAGAFDGVLGVTLALELAELAQQMPAPFAIEVIAFSEEEGVRFGVPFLGSRAVAGSFDRALLALKDAQGATVEEVLRGFGLDPSQLEDALLDESTAAFLEMHIEQGPVLEAEELSIAAVTGIVGQTRATVEFAGQANHAGTTPMHLRKDALAGGAEWIAAVEALAVHSEGLVATVGKAEVEPNAGNVIAGVARLTLDVRHEHDAVRINAAESLLGLANAIAGRRGLSLQSARTMDQPAVVMDERLTQFIVDALAACGLPPRKMPSGAGHDAMVMAARVPTAMLFVRSPGGVSHSPAETVREEDVEAALRVGASFLERLAAALR